MERLEMKAGICEAFFDIVLACQCVRDARGAGSVPTVGEKWRLKFAPFYPHGP